MVRTLSLLAVVVAVGGAASMVSSCSSSSSTVADAGTGGSQGGPDARGDSPGSGGTVVDGGGEDAGTGGSGGGLERGPTPATPGHNFPFPQNRESPNCAYPTDYDNDDVRAAYAKWKADNVTTDGANGFQRVKRPNEPGLEKNSTVSEGIAYGMLVAVYMDDQALFDNLWKYEQKWVDTKGLMNWYINAAGTGTLGTGAATDADEDMAWALLMADKQWGTSPTLGAYVNIAKDLIGKIWTYEVEGGSVLKPGDGWGGSQVTNPSYFAPAYYKVFSKVTGNNGWDNVATKSYEIINATLTASNGNQSNGLVPAWCSASGGPGQGQNIYWYQYDSCRTPFRIALDWCYFGDTRAKAYLEKTSTFFSSIGATAIVDGYNLNGTARAENAMPSLGSQAASFVGPAGVGAMVGSQYKTFLTDAYNDIAQLNLLLGGMYYDESWTVMSLLMMTGNFLNYTAP